MKHLTVTMLILVCLAPNYLSAAESPPPVETPQATEPQSAPADDKDKTIQKQSQTNKRGGDDVFNPSEEISEDYAVSFPVDI